MTLMKFTQAVCEKIGYYVYILKDPRDGKIFYIGKGKGNRLFDHVNALLDSSNDSNESDKLELIRKIGLGNVQHLILRHGLSENQAFEIESTCIDLIELDNLKNEYKGHDSWERGLKTVDEVIQYYNAEVITITEPAIIININKLYKRFMSPEKLYEVTRSAWVLGSKKDEAKYVLAAYRGLVREVYRIKSWEKVEKRWAFSGEIAEASIRDKYLNKSLEKYISQGNQNLIRYTF